MNTMLKVHWFVDNKQVLANVVPHCPRVGDTVRYSDDKYAKVTEVIWCVDEFSSNGQRVNLRTECEED